MYTKRCVCVSYSEMIVANYVCFQVSVLKYNGGRVNMCVKMVMMGCAYWLVGLIVMCM